MDRANVGSSAGASARSTVSRGDSSVTAAGATGTGGTCPAIGPGTVCHASAPADAPVVLVPSTASVSLAGETIGFDLHNRSGSRLAFRPYRWQVWRASEGGDGRWTRIDDDGGRESVGETVLSPDGSYAWQVAVGPVTVDADRPPVTVNDVEFETGRYAFAVPARTDRERTYVASFTVTE